jgi:EAP30/Vps36 family
MMRTACSIGVVCTSRVHLMMTLAFLLQGQDGGVCVNMASLLDAVMISMPCILWRGCPHLSHGRCACSARGLELVSPDDLRSAAELLEELGLPVRLRVFPSGAAVVQDASWSDDAACERIVGALSPSAAEAGEVIDKWLGRGLSVPQYALSVRVAVPVAREQLLLAERLGFVCRDDSAEGLFFYRNFFAELSTTL